jgi:TM2 domain-containing membrane protein YozV
MAVKDKTICIILSNFLGWAGIDRMYLGCWGTGLLKLVTLGGLGIWYFIDLILLLVNGIYESDKEAICGGYTWSPHSIKYGWWASAIIIFTSFFAPILLLILGSMLSVVGALGPGAERSGKKKKKKMPGEDGGGILKREEEKEKWEKERKEKKEKREKEKKEKKEKREKRKEASAGGGPSMFPATWWIEGG